MNYDNKKKKTYYEIAKDLGMSEEEYVWMLVKSVWVEIVVLLFILWFIFGCGSDKM